jgi:hypothetical protein
MAGCHGRTLEVTGTQAADGQLKLRGCMHSWLHYEVDPWKKTEAKDRR